MDLDAIPWDAITPTGLLLGLIALMARVLIRGDLIPRRFYLDMEKQRDDAIKRERYWQRLHEERSRQVNTLLPGVDTSSRFIESVVKRTGADPVSGDAEPEPDGEV